MPPRYPKVRAMASVTRQTDLTIWIDQSLDYLTGEWKAVPKIAADWDDRDELERLDFVVEWPLREDRLLLLKQWHREGVLSASQLQRFSELQHLIERHRTTLERLLAD
jgi:hypothetical protein